MSNWARSWMACKLARRGGKNLTPLQMGQLQDIVISEGVSKHIYIFALGVPGAEVGKLQTALISSSMRVRDPSWLAHFAHNVPGADREQLLGFVKDLQTKTRSTLALNG